MEITCFYVVEIPQIVIKTEAVFVSSRSPPRQQKFHQNTRKKLSVKSLQNNKDLIDNVHTSVSEGVIPAELSTGSQEIKPTILKSKTQQKSSTYFRTEEVLL